MNIEHCPVCDKPGHPCDTDGLGRHPECQPITDDLGTALYLEASYATRSDREMSRRDWTGWMNCYQPAPAFAVDERVELVPGFSVGVCSPRNTDHYEEEAS